MTRAAGQMNAIPRRENLRGIAYLTI